MFSVAVTGISPGDQCCPSRLVRRHWIWITWSFPRIPTSCSRQEDDTDRKGRKWQVFLLQCWPNTRVKNYFLDRKRVTQEGMFDKICVCYMASSFLFSFLFSAEIWAVLRRELGKALKLGKLTTGSLLTRRVDWWNAKSIYQWWAHCITSKVETCSWNVPDNQTFT